jgi:hypothetical protein
MISGNRRARALVACALTTVACGAFAATASAGKTNTFNGSCTNVPVDVTFAHPLTLTLELNTFEGIANGGTCSGTLNGQQIDGVPLWADFTPTGLQNCAGSDLAGPFYAVVDGKSFNFPNTSEHRAGISSVIQGDADGGGSLLAFTSANSPSADQFASECASTGVTEAGVVANQVVFSNATSPVHDKPPKR